MKTKQFNDMKVKNIEYQHRQLFALVMFISALLLIIIK